MNWGDGGGVKVERAKEHIAELESAITAYIADAYRFADEVDPQTGDRVYVVEFISQPPLTLGAIASDIVNNLNSSLDILWRSVVGERGPRKDFPRFPDADHCKAAHGGKPNSPGHRAMDVAKRAEIYPRGKGRFLWILNEIDNESKHHLLLLSCAAAITIIPLHGIGFVDLSGQVTEMWVPQKRSIGPLYGRTVIQRVPAAAQMQVKPQAMPQVGFSPTGVFSYPTPLPMVKVLGDILGAVEGVVAGFRDARLIS